MSYRDLINIRYKLFGKILIFILLVILTMIIIFPKKITDVYNTYGYIYNHKLIVNIPIDNPDTISKLKYIRVNDIKYDKNAIINISDVLIDQLTLTNYQEITLSLSKEYQENQILNVSFYFNEEKVLKKLRKLFL